MILATFVFADGEVRQSEVPDSVPTEVAVLDVPELRSWFPAGSLQAVSKRLTFALEEGGPPYRYRQVVGAAAPQSGVVWKFPVPITGRFTLSMPGGARILTVQDQRGEVQLWALVDPGQPSVVRSFALYGTGHPFEYAREEGPPAYVGTFQQLDGRLVWHLFELAGLSRAGAGVAW